MPGPPILLPPPRCQWSLHPPVLVTALGDPDASITEYSARVLLRLATVEDLRTFVAEAGGRQGGAAAAGTLGTRGCLLLIQFIFSMNPPSLRPGNNWVHAADFWDVGMRWWLLPPCNHARSLSSDADRPKRAAIRFDAPTPGVVGGGSG